jgi:hypothetical protein
VLPGVIDETGSSLSYTHSSSSTDQHDVDSIATNESQLQDSAFREWKFATRNGIIVTMYGIRTTHSHGNLQELQRKKFHKIRTDNTSTHRIELHAAGGGILGYSRKPRPVFESRALRGYNAKRTSPSFCFQHDLGNICLPQPWPLDAYGTIIHPSVYFLQDTYPNFGISKALKQFNENLDLYREELQPISGSNNVRCRVGFNKFEFPYAAVPGLAIQPC